MKRTLINITSWNGNRYETIDRDWAHKIIEHDIEKMANAYLKRDLRCTGIYRSDGKLTVIFVESQSPTLGNQRIYLKECDSEDTSLCTSCGAPVVTEERDGYGCTNINCEY